MFAGAYDDFGLAGQHAGRVFNQLHREPTMKTSHCAMNLRRSLNDEGWLVGDADDPVRGPGPNAP